MTGGHADPGELERETLSPEVTGHLASCARCRAERRLLRAGPPSGATPADPGLFDAARTAALRGGWRPPSSAPAYEVGELLGQGATAEVRRAFDPALRRHIALKLLRTAQGASRTRFIAEAQVTSQLDHPNIVPVHHMGVTSDGRPYVAMREVHGQSLTEAVQTGRLPTLRARVDALRKVCAGVAFAHHRGVLHRDLKPDNVMIGEFGEVLVVDWGLARPLDASAIGDGVEADRFDAAADRTREGRIAGTPAWMAPEQARGDLAALDARTDVYALGAILFFLATGRPPIEGDDADATIDAVRAGRIPAPRDVDRAVPREVDAIVRRAMAPDPGRRYPDVRSFLEDLDAWVDRRPLPHVGSRLTERLEKLADRNRRVLRAVGAMLVLGGGTAAAGGWRYIEDTNQARAAAAAEADRAREAERRVVLGGARTRVALADAARLDGREREAADALEEAAAALVAAGGDTRNLDMARASLHVASPPPLATCRPFVGDPVRAVAVAPDGTGALALGDSGRLAAWDPADCRSLADDRFAAAPFDSAVAWLDTGPAAVAWVGDALVHLRPGAGEIARAPLPAGLMADDGTPRERATVAGLSLTPWGEGALVAPDGRWWTFHFGDPTVRQEARWPRVPGYLTLVPGGRSVLASTDPHDSAHGGLWDRRTLRLRQAGWYTGDPPGGERLALVDRAEGPAGVDLLDGRVRFTTGESRYVTVAGAPGGRYATIAWPGTAQVYDLDTGSVVRRLTLPAAWERVTTSRDARVVLGWGGGEVSTWLLADPRADRLAPEAPAEASPMVAASPDGRLLALAGAGGVPGIELVDVATRVHLRHLPTEAMIHTLAFSPDGETLAATLQGGGRVAWAVVTGAERWRGGTGGETLPLAWVADELVTVDAHGDALVLDGRDGQERRRWPALTGPSWDIAAVPGSRRVVVGAYTPGSPAAVVLDIDSGAIVHRLDRHAARAQVAVAPDGSFAALAGWDGRTVLWDLTTGEVTQELDARIGPTIGTDISPDGTLVATAGFDKQVSFWDAATGERLRTSALGRTGSRVRFAPRGSLLVVTWSWMIREVPLDAHNRFRDAVASLHGEGLPRARAFAELGWWERVVPELARTNDDPLLRAQAWLASGRIDEAARAARAAPDSVYQRLLTTLAR